MDQMSFLLYPEERAFESIRPSLERVLQEYWLSSSDILFKQNKGYFSVLFRNSAVIARFGGKKKLYFSVPTVVSKGYSVDLQPVDDPKEGYSKYFISSFDEVAKYAELFMHILRELINGIPKDFDCCSRYLECSNAKQCLNPDKELALGCGYRKIMREGQFFYGVNRNV